MKYEDYLKLTGFIDSEIERVHKEACIASFAYPYDKLSKKQANAKKINNDLVWEARNKKVQELIDLKKTLREAVHCYYKVHYPKRKAMQKFWKVKDDKELKTKPKKPNEKNRNSSKSRRA